MTIHGSCHCGATRFEVPRPPESVTSCNCTFCYKRGVIWAYYPPDQVTFKSREQVVGYQRSGPRHHHCGVCGCGTFTETPTWGADGKPDFSRPRVGLNARLFDDFDLAPVPVEHLDGRNLW